MLNINLLHLHYFCDAVRLGGITPSAKKNLVSQSAISQAITKLESALSLKLITHQPNRFKLTYEGERIFEKGVKIFRAFSELEESIIQEEEDQHYVGRLEFACTHSFALALLPQQLKKLQKRAPYLHVNFRLGHTDAIREWMKMGMIDFGIVLDNEDLSAYDCYEIYSGEYRLYAAKESPSEEELPIIMSEERLETHLLKDGYRKSYGKEMKILMEVQSWEVIANLTEEGLGAGFFPDYIAIKRGDRLRPYPLELPKIPYKVVAIFPKGSGLHPNAELFLSLF